MYRNDMPRHLSSASLQLQSPRYLSSACRQLQQYRAPRWLTVQGSSDTCSGQRPKGKLLGYHSNSVPSIHFVGFPPSGYPGGDPPMMDGTVNEPPCPHCLFGPCIICRPPVFLSGRAAPSLANDRKRYRLYLQFWQVLRDLGLWNHPTYLMRKGLVTHPSDRREIMPKYVQNVKHIT